MAMWPGEDEQHTSAEEEAPSHKGEGRECHHRFLDHHECDTEEERRYEQPKVGALPDGH